MADRFCRSAASGDGKLVATGSADQAVRFWDASTGRELQRLSVHQGAIKGVSILPDNASVVVGGSRWGDPGLEAGSRADLHRP